MAAKLSAELAQRLQGADASSLLDIIVELHPALEEIKIVSVASRNERIAAMKADVEKRFAPVEQAIVGVGGEVTGHAWINKTLRARLPVSGVMELCQREEVAGLDVPHAIQPERG